MDVFDLFATISLDSSEYDKGLNEAKSKGEGFGSKIGNALGAAGKIAAVGLSAAAAGVTALGMQSVNEYKNYEQLVGGVQKLYGNMGQSLEDYTKAAQEQGMTAEEAELKWHYLEKAQTDVMENAKEAYKTAGMSANQYMETATSFSAALINSLEGDTVAAAAQTDVAMRAISDNVNTFGTNMDSVTNAFMGFSKQNYTMLDNLKLGYGGTKKEMERLIEDANEYAAANGKAADLSIDSFSDIVTAIQYVQEQQNIAGTTAREAAGTIEGSMNMLKGAWENLVAGFANPDADLGKLMNDVVDSASTAFNNLLPAVERALGGIATFIGNIAPVLTQQLPTVFNTVLPVAINALTTFVSSLAKSLPDIVKVLVDQLPMLVRELLPAVIEALGQLAIALVQSIPAVVSAIYQSLVTAFQTGLPVLQEVGNSIYDTLFGNMNAGTIMTKGYEAISSFIQGVADALPGIIEKGGEMITGFIDSVGQKLPMALTLGTDLLIQVINGITNALPSLITAIGNIIKSALEFFKNSYPTLISSAISIITAIANGLLSAMPTLISTVGEILVTVLGVIIQNIPVYVAGIITLIQNLISAVVTNLPGIIEAFVNVFGQLVSTLGEYGGKLVSSIGASLSKLIATAVSWLSQLPGKMAYYAGYAVSQFINFIVTLPEKIAETFTNVMAKVKEFATNFTKEAPEAAKKFKNDLIDGLKELPGKMMEKGKEIIDRLKQGISDAWDNLVSWFKDKAASLWSSFTEGFGKGKKDAEGKVESSTKNAALPSTRRTIESLEGVVETESTEGSENTNTGLSLSENQFEALADAIVDAFIRADIGISVDNKEFGRIVRKAVVIA